MGEVAKAEYLTCKQKQLSQTTLIKIQLPLYWDQHSAVPLPVINYLLTGLLVPYREILSPRFLRTDLASSVRTSKPRA